jgi:hypothetical protein
MRDVSVDARFAPPTKTSNSAGVLPMLHLPPFASTGTSPLMRVLVRNGLALVRMSSIPHFIPFPVHDPYHAPHYPSNELLEIEGSTAVQHSLPCRIPRLLVILLNFPQCTSFLSIFCTLGCVWTIVEHADCGAYGHAAQFLLFHRGAALTFYVCVQYSTNHARLYIHPAKGYTHPEFSARMGTYFIVLNQVRTSFVWIRFRASQESVICVPGASVSILTFLLHILDPVIPPTLQHTRSSE